MAGVVGLPFEDILGGARLIPVFGVIIAVPMEDWVRFMGWGTHFPSDWPVGVGICRPPTHRSSGASHERPERMIQGVVCN